MSPGQPPPDVTPGTDCNPEDPTCDVSGGIPIGGPGGTDIGPNPLPGTTGDTGGGTTGTSTTTDTGPPPPPETGPPPVPVVTLPPIVPVPIGPSTPAPPQRGPVRPPTRTPPTEPPSNPVGIGLPRPPVIPVPIRVPTGGGGGFIPAPTRGPTLGGNNPSGEGQPPIDITLPAPVIDVTQSAPNVTVYVQVTNAETIGAEVAQTVASAVNAGISDGIDYAASVANQAFGSISDALKQVVDKIWQGIENLASAIASHLGDIIKGLADNIGKIVKGILDAIGPVIEKIGTVIANAIKNLPEIIHNIATTIQRINDTLIQPIANVILKTYTTIATLTVAIERDLHSGLAGILAIPGQIAGGLTTIDATLQRTLQQLGIINVDTINSTWKPIIDGSIGGPLSSIATSLGTTTNPGQLTTTYSAIDKLGTQCGVNNFNEQIAAFRGDPNDQPGWYNWLVRGFMDIITSFGTIYGWWQNVSEVGKQQANLQCAIQLLPISSTIEAWKRGFLDDATLQAELAKQGINADRAKVFTDLSKFLEPSDTLIDYFFRSIINDSDLTKGLQDLGYTAPQIQALKEGAQNLPQTTEILRWRHFGLIDDNTAKTMLQQLRWRSEHADAILATEQQRVTAKDRANLDGRLNATQLGWLVSTMLAQTPQEVIDAGRRDGLSDDNIRLLWQSHWNTPGYDAIIQSYFRGMRTRTEVGYAMTEDGVPPELWDELIEIRRPLIPYRSVPTMVKAGVMSEARAATVLAQHGFSLEDINSLLALIGVQKSTVKTAAASAVHAVSISNARSLFDQGAISEDQYVAILEEHGYTPELAKTTADVEAVAAHVKQRKQLIADSLAEVIGGVTTLQSAIQFLQNQGATDAEIARFEVAAAKSLRHNQKSPSEPELAKFLKAGLISQDAYTNELQRQGWATQWIEAFLGLIVVQTPSTPATLPSTP